MRRYHGTVNLDETRVGRDASRIADEVIAHLTGLVGADVRVTLERGPAPEWRPRACGSDGDRELPHVEVFHPRVRIGVGKGRASVPARA